MLTAAGADERGGGGHGREGGRERESSGGAARRGRGGEVREQRRASGRGGGGEGGLYSLVREQVALGCRESIWKYPSHNRIQWTHSDERGTERMVAARGY